jgi:hypothetical protein
MIRTIACSIAQRGEDNCAVTCSGMLVLMLGKNIGMLIVRAPCTISNVYHVQALSLKLKLVALKQLHIKRRRHEIGYTKWLNQRFHLPMSYMQINNF